MEDKIMLAIVGFLLVFVLVLGYWVGSERHYCISKGYPDYITSGFDRYCARVENGRSVLVPIGEVK